MKKSVLLQPKFVRILIAAILILVILYMSQIFSVRNEAKPITKSDFILDTIVSITLYGDDMEGYIDECFRICKDYEELLSRTIDSSEVSMLNDRDTNNQLIVSDETAKLLQYGYFYSNLSDGFFDITIEPLSSLWSFSSSPTKPPSDEDILQAVSKVDYHNVILDGNQVTFLSDQTRIDLGAIAKGYIADRLKEYLISQGVESGIIDLGGNILCIGSKPDGTPYQIGIQKPFDARNETIASVALHDMSVVSSGVYERNFVYQDKNYHHILDPKTGYPYDNGLVSVTILSPLSVDGDGLSTTCFSLGLEKGMELIDSLENTYALFITSDYELHYSEGFPPITEYEN